MTDHLSWWQSMPDGLWAVVGVVLTLVGTSIIEISRNMRARKDRAAALFEARRQERATAYRGYLDALNIWKSQTKSEPQQGQDSYPGELFVAAQAAGVPVTLYGMPGVVQVLVRLNPLVQQITDTASDSEARVEYGRERVKLHWQMRLDLSPELSSEDTLSPQRRVTRMVSALRRSRVGGTK
jgi:hypothetical protein